MISLASVFLIVIGTLAPPVVAYCLFKGHLLDADGDATESVSDFPLKKNTYI